MACVSNLLFSSHAWHDSFLWGYDSGFGLIFQTHISVIRDTTHSYVTWLRHLSNVTYFSHMWHDSFICNMTHSHVTYFSHMWHDSFICNMTHSHVTYFSHMWHDSFICDMTHSYVTCFCHSWLDPCTRDMIHLHVNQVAQHPRGARWRRASARRRRESIRRGPLTWGSKRREAKFNPTFQHTLP